MNEINKEKSPHGLLYILCILTFIGSGFGFIVSILSIVNIDYINFIEEIPGYTSLKTNTIDAHFLYPISKTIFYITSLLGALYMLKLKIKGFYIYSISQLILPTLSFIFFDYPLLHTFSIALPSYIFGIAFIMLYALHIKDMKKYSIAE